MYRIAAMGDRDSIYGFAALGLDIYPAEDAETAKKLFKKLDNDNYAVIYITEALAALVPDDIDKYRDRVTPAIILIPGVSGNTGDGMSNVRKSVETAVGSNILD